MISSAYVPTILPVVDGDPELIIGVSGDALEEPLGLGRRQDLAVVQGRLRVQAEDLRQVGLGSDPTNDGDRTCLPQGIFFHSTSSLLRRLQAMQLSRDQPRRYAGAGTMPWRRNIAHTSASCSPWTGRQ